MTLYSIVLYLHVLAAIELFATLGFEGLSLFHLRRASTLAEARLWIELVPRLPLVTAASGLIVLCSGVYLTMRMEAFNLAWLKVSLAALLLIAPLGVLTGRRMRGIRHVCASATAMSPELLNRLQYLGLKISLGIRSAVFSGIVLLMAAKPDLWQSVGIVGCSVAFGLLLSLVSWRRTGSLSARGAGAEGRSRTAWQRRTTPSPSVHKGLDTRYSTLQHKNWLYPGGERGGHMEVVLIDRFTVPEESKVAFLAEARRSAAFLQTLPGFVEADQKGLASTDSWAMPPISSTYTPVKGRYVLTRLQFFTAL